MTARRDNGTLNHEARRRMFKILSHEMFLMWVIEQLWSDTNFGGFELGNVVTWAVNRYLGGEVPAALRRTP